MREIQLKTRYKKDLKREAKGQHRDTLKNELKLVIFQLASDIALDEKYQDHPLTGNWKGYRDCHVKPDLVLIYRKTENGELELLELTRLGSHSELDL